MISSLLRRLSFPFAVAALVLSVEASAQAPPADQQIENFIRVVQFASPYGNNVRIPEQWCYYTKTELAYNWWYLTSPKTGILTPIQGGNGFVIPFALDNYSVSQGVIIVGYVIDGGTSKIPLSKVSFSSPAPCRIGTEILTRGPYPITGIASDLANMTAVDAAPEYHYWPLLRRFHAARWILAIPTSFQVGGDEEVAGRIIVAFSAK